MKGMWRNMITIVPFMVPGLCIGGQSIRSIDMASYLVQSRGLVDMCKEFSGREVEDPIHFLDVEYADLTGDGQEEVVVEAATCVMNTGGSDIVEVFRMGPNGTLESLPTSEISGPTEVMEGCCHSTPRLDVVGGRLTRWYPMFAKDWDHPKHGRYRVVTYQWKEGRFIPRKNEETKAVPSKDAAEPAAAPDASRR
jgi:hypothetical protein